MSDTRGHRPLDPVTLRGCSKRHINRLLYHRIDDFVDQNDEPFASSSSSSNNPASNEEDTYIHTGEDAIRRKLSWFFTTPYQKFRQKGRKPWKLVLQIFKIALITAQATWFAVDLQSVVSFNTDNLAAFRHIFIKNYPGGLMFVPIFTKPDLYERMHYVWSRYHNFTNVTVGSYQLAGPESTKGIQLCISKLIPDLGSEYDGDDVKKKCHYLKKPNSLNTNNVTYFVMENKIPQTFEFVAKIVMKFSLKTKNRKSDLEKSQADCYVFDVIATFNNDDYDGKLEFRLFNERNFTPCDTRRTKMSYVKLSIEIFIIILCIISLVLCIRSFLKHLKLSRETTKFFKEFRHEKLTLSDKMNFLNFWIILIIVSDTLVICGTVIKICIDFTDVSSYDACALLLGTAVLFSWVGILRYLGYLKGYNAMLVTLKVAFPQVVRFLVCAAIIYFGFCFCGWVVFGPYHEKFKDIITTSECLFSLVNGDDMFNTFKLMDQEDYTLWMFSKLYLYLFISLFIFVILSLFIGIISDTYERIKDYGHPPKTRIELFMEGLEYHEPDTEVSGSDSERDTFSDRQS